MDEKRFELTDEQCERLWEAHTALDSVGKILGSAIMAASEESAKRERMLWDVVRRITGEDPKHRKHKIDWVNRCVVVTDHERE